MRKTSQFLGAALFAVFALSSCTKEVKEQTQDEPISETVLAQIKAHGFGTGDVQRVEDGYLVEGDILLTTEYLNRAADGKLLRIANVEQYHTTNLVKS
ncbi:MAG: hypothetical protein RIR90_146, partial [Bacteroidota bacterium]